MSTQTTMSDKLANATGGKRAQQARDTKHKILQAAIKVFAEDGFSGGRIERISREANSNDRMIYYYFGNKEKLFLAVLEATYLAFYDAENALELSDSSPIEAVKEIVAFTFRYYLDHPEFVAILNDENLHRAKHSSQSENIRNISGNIQGNLAPLLEVGQQSGLFRKEVTASHLYLTISALTYFYCSNQHTLTVFVGKDFQNSAFQHEWLKHISDVVIRSVIAN
ncbi:TetR family transcriptional regulator [Marinomonas sp.]|nr:TetR/AcrR family transcriptional regulator [Marinomonas sp.]MDB4836977.1 TetR family transcriptional regulator [Marinomonas sp.]